MIIVQRVVSVFRAGGPVAVLRAVWRRIRMPHARCFSVCRAMVQGGIGMEIGGPSTMFAGGGLLPLYPLAERIDNCNAARHTIWEGAVTEGNTFAFRAGKSPGRQFVAEGADLPMVESASYDFVLSCHMLEHTANPLRAIGEWKRLLKSGGGLVLVVPHRDGTFDHRRPVTELKHLVDDLERGTGEDDRTHVPEILALHDNARDPGVHEMTFRERAERNVELRSLHHHVFDTRLAVEAVQRAGLEVVAVEPLEPFHIIVLARKARVTVSSFPDATLRAVLRQSVFPSDRQSA